MRTSLWRQGLRYRKNHAGLPGRPDIVFVKARVAVFVDGDFWHGRDWDARKSKLQVGSNAPYWVSKIAANIERDVRTTQRLQDAGWIVLRIWETDIQRNLDAAVQMVQRAIGRSDDGR